MDYCCTRAGTSVTLRPTSFFMHGYFMRQDGLPPEKDAGLTGYFSQVTHPVQIALLGRITVDILRQERRLTRTALCLKLIARLDCTGDEAEAAHLTALLRMLFNR